MATKDYCLSLKDKNDIIVNDNTFDPQYKNLNLNQNHQITVDNIVNQSKSSRKEVDYGTAAALIVSDFTNSNSKSQNFSNSWNKSNKTLSPDFLIINDDKKEVSKEKDTSLNNSTLSLHISAYENSIEAAVADTNVDENEDAKKKNQFEFPRQQKNIGNQLPEISQFKASQRLLNPNDRNRSKNEFQNFTKSFGQISIHNDHEANVQNFHSGLSILKEEIERYGFSSIAQFKEYFKKETDFFSHVKDGRKKFLMVAEKNSLAKEISKHLSNGYFKEVKYEADCKRVEVKTFMGSNEENEHDSVNFKSDETKDASEISSNATSQKRDRDNEMPYITAYEFTCKIHDFEIDILMCATNGHLCSEKFKDEKVSKGEEFFAANRKIVKELAVENNNRKYYPQWLQEFATGRDGLVLWLDNDDEGESIGFEVIDYVKNCLNLPPNGHVMDAIYRATFYSSSKSQVENAMKNLVRPNLLKHLAMIDKHFLDLIMGKAFTMHQKRGLRIRHPDHEIRDLPFGPCQTTVLKMIVDQWRLTKNYVPNYIVEISISVGGKTIKAQSGEYADEKTVAQIVEILRAYKSCEVVEEPSQKLITVEPPEGLYSMEFYKMASEHLNIDPSQAMNHAEDLYINGFVTYPRTGSTKYPSDLNVSAILKQITNNSSGLSAISSSQDISNIQESMKRGIEIGNHAPIMPTGKIPNMTYGFKKSPKGKIYEFIRNYFLASFMGPYQYLQESVTFSIAGGYKFHTSFNTPVTEGFTKLLPWMKVATEKDDEILQHFISGSTFECSTKFVPTPPPRLLTESKLIKKMEENHIGTDGSVPEHLKNLKDVGYVKIDRFGRQYTPTELGLRLIEAYEKCIPEIIKPEYRAQFIKEINDIASGDAGFDEVFDKNLNRIWNDYKSFSATFTDEILDPFERCFKLKETPPPPEPINNNPKLKVLLQ